MKNLTHGKLGIGHLGNESPSRNKGQVRSRSTDPIQKESTSLPQNLKDEGLSLHEEVKEAHFGALPPIEKKREMLMFDEIGLDEREEEMIVNYPETQ